MASLNEADRISLITITSSPAWDVLNRLMVDTAKEVILDYLSTDIGDKDRVLAGHAASQAVVNFYYSIHEAIARQTEVQLEETKERALEQELKQIKAGLKPEQYEKFLGFEPKAR